MNHGTRRIGVFFIDWKLIHDDLPGVQEAFHNLMVIGAQPDDKGVKYVALSVDSTFVEIPNGIVVALPEYDLRLGIHADGSRYSRWVKK